LSPNLLIAAGLQSGDGAAIALGTEYLAAAAVASTTKGDQQQLIDLASRYPESNVQRALRGAFRPEYYIYHPSGQAFSGRFVTQTAVSPSTNCYSHGAGAKHFGVADGRTSGMQYTSVI